jgi:hypothetical protein
MSYIYDKGIAVADISDEQRLLLKNRDTGEFRTDVRMVGSPRSDRYLSLCAMGTFDLTTGRSMDITCPWLLVGAVKRILVP